MSDFTNSIGGFQTGDLVFVRYPPRGTQPIRVTVFLDGTSPHGDGYPHAGTTNAELRSAVAAPRWPGRTPGSCPPPPTIARHRLV